MTRWRKEKGEWRAVAQKFSILLSPFRDITESRQPQCPNRSAASFSILLYTRIPNYANHRFAIMQQPHSPFYCVID